MDKMKIKRLLKEKSNKKTLYRFKMFLIEYGFYKEVVDLYIMHRIPSINLLNCAYYLSAILLNEKIIFNYFGANFTRFTRKYEQLKELNDLWLLEVIYNKCDFSYEDKYKAVLNYNQLHRGEMETFRQIINGKEVFFVRQKTISWEKIKTILNRN